MWTEYAAVADIDVTLYRDDREWCEQAAYRRLHRLSEQDKLEVDEGSIRYHWVAPEGLPRFAENSRLGVLVCYARMRRL